MVPLWLHRSRRAVARDPHSQLDDLILLIHQGLKGWEAEDKATGSAAQQQSLKNRIQRGIAEAWETEWLRAGAAGACHAWRTPVPGPYGPER